MSSTSRLNHHHHTHPPTHPPTHSRQARRDAKAQHSAHESTCPHAALARKQSGSCEKVGFCVALFLPCATASVKLACWSLPASSPFFSDDLQRHLRVPWWLLVGPKNGRVLFGYGKECASALRCFQCSCIRCQKHITSRQLAPNASAARKCCSSVCSTSLQTDTCLLLARSASVEPQEIVSSFPNVTACRPARTRSTCCRRRSARKWQQLHSKLAVLTQEQAGCVCVKVEGPRKTRVLA